MKILIEQEKALHQFETRQSKSEICSLLHPNFQEVGVSGATHTLEGILKNMESEKSTEGFIQSQGYECIELEPTVKLLLYKSAWVDSSGSKSDFAKRASIWVLVGDNWQMKYHQGTPCSEF